jgi:circadian clock protein KaiC
MDTWLGLRVVETGSSRRREFFVLKSRGMSHSHAVKEMVLGSRGIQLLNGERAPRAARVSRTSKGIRP